LERLQPLASEVMADALRWRERAAERRAASQAAQLSAFATRCIHCGAPHAAWRRLALRGNAEEPLRGYFQVRGDGR
jgi:ribosomal protein S14